MFLLLLCVQALHSQLRPYPLCQTTGPWENSAVQGKIEKSHSHRWQSLSSDFLPNSFVAQLLCIVKIYQTIIGSSSFHVDLFVSCLLKVAACYFFLTLIIPN